MEAGRIRRLLRESERERQRDGERACSVVSMYCWCMELVLIPYCLAQGRYGLPGIITRFPMHLDFLVQKELCILHRIYLLRVLPCQAAFDVEYSTFILCDVLTSFGPKTLFSYPRSSFLTGTTSNPRALPASEHPAP